MPNVSDGSNVSLSSFVDARGIVVIFTSNNCPYSKLYEARIMYLHQTYANNGLQIVLVNSNNPELSPDDNKSRMKTKATNRKYPFPYLADKSQQVSKAFGARKNPEVFLLKPNGPQFHVIYRGSIDDNPQNEQDVKNAYLIEAIERLLQNKPIQNDTSRPIGCMIKS